MLKKAYKIVFVDDSSYARKIITYHVVAKDWKDAGNKAIKQFVVDNPNTDIYEIGELELIDVRIIS